MKNDTAQLRTHLMTTAEPGLDAVPLRAWGWMLIGQLWMLAAFAGMSLVVIAALSAFHGGAGHRIITLLATGCTGALLMVLAWHGMARMLQRVERYEPRDPRPGARQTPGHGPSTSPVRPGLAGITPSW